MLAPLIPPLALIIATAVTLILRVGKALEQLADLLVLGVQVLELRVESGFLEGELGLGGGQGWTGLVIV